MILKKKVKVIEQIASENGYLSETLFLDSQTAVVSFIEKQKIIIEYEIHDEDSIIGFARAARVIDEFAEDLVLNLLGRPF